MSMNYDPDARRDTALALKLKARIRADGPLTIAQYMRACLYDPERGYYRTRLVIGRDGDFITAPEISQIFGELIGLWCVVVWQQIGSPKRFRLVELGPGRGTMMTDVLRATRGVAGFHPAARVSLVENNRALEKEQRNLLASSGVDIEWHHFPDALSHPDDLVVPAIVIANEVLDCEPRDQIVRTESGWRERMVTLHAGGALAFAPGAPAVQTGMVPFVQRTGREADGDIFEPTPRHWSRTIMQGRPHVAALFIDYGHSELACGDTFQAVRAHRSEHPLTSPGEADLTMQVDFAAQRVLFGELPSPFRCDGPTTQAEFLGRLGIVERASRLMAANPAKAAAIETGVARLMAPNGMGTRFKAIGIRSAHLPPLPGF